MAASTSLEHQEKGAEWHVSLRECQHPPLPKKASDQNSLQDTTSDSPLAASNELIGTSAALQGMKQSIKDLGVHSS